MDLLIAFSLGFTGTVAVLGIAVATSRTMDWLFGAEKPEQPETKPWEHEG